VRSRALLVAVAGALLLPVRAEAHLVTTGLGPVFDGIGHFFLTLQDLLPALALALYAGLRGPAAGRGVLFGLTGAWLAGGLAGLAVGTVVPEGTAIISLLLLGGLVAADLRLPRGVVIGLAVGVGLVHGFANGAVMAAAGLGWGGLVGITVSLFTVTALAAAGVVALQVPWTRIAVRVAGSWITAVGLLLLGWTLGPLRSGG
jgi:hydrogenase/urease accessory protein HupE